MCGGAYSLALRKLRQEVSKLEASLDYIANLSQHELHSETLPQNKRRNETLVSGKYS
jgi:hypothetical protein